MYFSDFESNMHMFYSFTVKYKNQSLLMKIIGALLFFNKDFMTKFVTTIGNTIYFPNEEYITNNDQGAIGVLAHELVHVCQANKYSNILFGFMYLFPQCLVLLSLLAVFGHVFLWFLLFLAFLVPIPAPWRKNFEVSGYTMSLFVLYLQLRFFKNSDADIARKLCAEAIRIDDAFFKGSAYLFMWPFGVIGEFENKIKDIQAGVISDTDEIYGCVKKSYMNAVASYEL
jgi:hypothetical protein